MVTSLVLSLLTYAQCKAIYRQTPISKLLASMMNGLSSTGFVQLLPAVPLSAALCGCTKLTYGSDYVIPQSLIGKYLLDNCGASFL